MGVINTVLLGVIVLLIDSEIAVYEDLMFGRVLSRLFKHIISMQSATKLTVYTLFFLPIQTFQQSGPLIKTLQFSMSLLRIDEFFSADRGFYYSHASTPMCDPM